MTEKKKMLKSKIHNENYEKQQIEEREKAQELCYDYNQIRPYKIEERKEHMRKMYYVYMLRCEDNSIYTGITNNIENRMEEHFGKDKKAAKYTKSHTPQKLEIVWQTENKSLASKLEYHIKTLIKKQKEQLIKNKNLDEFLSDKIETKKYIILQKN